jgi:hypothetical protein
MNSTKKVPPHELYYNLHRLNEFAKAVAYAKNSSEAEFMTIKYLRPQIEAVETILDEARSTRNNENA